MILQETRRDELCSSRLLLNLEGLEKVHHLLHKKHLNRLLYKLKINTSLTELKLLLKGRDPDESLLLELFMRKG